MIKKRRIAAVKASDAQLVKDLLLSFKGALEQRDWNKLSGICASFGTVWNLDRPVRTSDWIDEIKARWSKVRKIDMAILRLGEYTVGETSAHVAFAAQIIWSVAGTGEERQMTFNWSIGLAKAGGSWKMDYLGFTPFVQVAAPVSTPRPSTRDLPLLSPSLSAVATPQIRASRGVIGDRPSIGVSPSFSASAMSGYLAELSRAGFQATNGKSHVAAGLSKAAAKNGYKVVYVPALVPAK